MKQLLFLAWQDPESRRWFTIGRLTFDGVNYQFVYTQGVREAQQNSNFQALHSFPVLGKVYRSSQLFPLFSNRLMRPSRPDYKEYIEWLNLPAWARDPIAILARSGGQKATDTLEVFACPEKDEDGSYHAHFFARGLQYLPDSNKQRVTQLQKQETLIFKPEPTNEHDPQAILVFTHDGYQVGYFPRYLAPDVHRLLNNNRQEVKVLVEQVNHAPIPIQFRLLCHLIAPWPDDFQPFSTAEYQPLITDGETDDSQKETLFCPV
jgi:HIRAN domain